MLKKAEIGQGDREADSAVGELPFSVPSIPAVNVASVPQRSPLRYPGGKTWLIPHVREWLFRTGSRHPLLVEPFVGGGIVSLTAVMEGLVERALMVDVDRDITALWRAVLNDDRVLVEQVRRFNPTLEQIQRVSRQTPRGAAEHGFRTLVLNRTRRGGGAGAGSVSH